MTAAGGSVLHFIDTTGPGGAETVFLDLAAGMQERGWRPHLVVVGPGWVLDQARSRGFSVDLVPTRGRFDWRYLYQLGAVVRRHKVDLIQAHLFSPTVYASLLGAMLRRPVVGTFHGASDVDARSASTRLRFELVKRQATIVAVSEMLEQSLLHERNVPPDRVRLIHNGVNVDQFSRGNGLQLRREHGVPDDAILVGALGNLRPAKDYHTLIRAAAAASSDPRLHFAIVGDPAEPLHRELKTLRDELGLQDRLSFWGFQMDAPAVLNAFDILAISSSSEGFSLAAIQAMAAGRPVVATRCGGPEHIIDDAENGVLVPTRSPEALANAIAQLAGDADLRARFGRAARHAVEEKFGLDACLDRYDRLYRELVAR